MKWISKDQIDSNYSKCQEMRDHGILIGKTFQMKQVLPVSFKSYHANIYILYRQKLKRYSTSLIGEMKIWMTQNYNFLLTRLTKKSTSLRYTLLTELWIHIFLVGMQNGTMYKDKNFAISIQSCKNYSLTQQSHF